MTGGTAIRTKDRDCHVHVKSLKAGVGRVGVEMQVDRGTVRHLNASYRDGKLCVGEVGREHPEGRRELDVASRVCLGKDEDIVQGHGGREDLCYGVPLQCYIWCVVGHTNIGA